MAFLGAQKTKQNARKMDSLSPRTWGKGLLNAISTPRGQTPSPQEAPRESSKTNKVLGSTVIAGAIGAGISLVSTEVENAQRLRAYGNQARLIPAAERAAYAIAKGARFAGAAGAFTAAEGPLLGRVLQAGGGLIAGSVAGNVAGTAVLAASKMQFGRPYV